MPSLPRKFYARDTVTVARDLLGKRLVRRAYGTVMSGVIAETEAYGHLDDPASHAHRGMTDRNAAMFGQVGRAYVYFTYGMHHCFNVVARAPGTAAGAVLVRAIIPERGIPAMERNRGGAPCLADGPAKLAQAMRITKKQCGADLVRDRSLCITPGPAPGVIVPSVRVGIKKAAGRMWNFSARHQESTGQTSRGPSPSRA